MSTRKLIGIALLCGLAILVAGGIQLFRILGADSTSLPRVGDRIDVSGVSATVTRAEVDDDGIVIAVEMSVSGDAGAIDDVAGAWTVSTAGDRNEPAALARSPDPAECPAEPLPSGTDLSCSLAFERGSGSPTARFTVRGLTGVWDLGGG